MTEIPTPGIEGTNRVPLDFGGPIGMGAPKRAAAQSK
jgi:hypothetical protein